MFRTYPIIFIRVAAVAFVLYYLLNSSSEAIKVSQALEQSQYLLRDLIRYFLLLLASIGFWQLYQTSLDRIGRWVLVAAIITAILGIGAYLSLSLNLVFVPKTNWQTSLLAFFEFLKGNFLLQFQNFVAGEQSLAAWLSNWVKELRFQFLPQLSDFPNGRGWIKLYLLFKLWASILLKFTVVFSCLMFLFSRPLVKQNLLVGLLIMLWLLSPIYGGSMSALGSWVLNVKAVNGDAVRNFVGLAIVVLIAFRMWVDAAAFQGSVYSKRKTTRKTVKKAATKRATKGTKKVAQKTAKKVTKTVNGKSSRKKAMKLPKTTILKK